MSCDLLLLTEVPLDALIQPLAIHRSAHAMTPGRSWAAVVSRTLMTSMPGPHSASAMARVDGLAVCSSVLPWRTCGTDEPWSGASTSEKTEAAVAAVEAAGPDVWGGDWNHALSGREWSGSKDGRRHIHAALERLGLQVPTADADHQIPGCFSIDHIAVPGAWKVRGVERHPATVAGNRISDHDAYVVDAEPRAAEG